VENTSPKKDGRNFALMVLAFFGVMCSANAVFVYYALHTYSGTVTDKSYEKGLAYNKVIEEAAEQDKLGITSKGLYQDGKFIFTFFDKNNTPVSGADVNARFIRAVKEGSDFTLKLQDKGNGRYESVVDAPYPGLWTVRTEVKWNGNQYSASHKIILR
jgi:nitrogen fixation protein FixH